MKLKVGDEVICEMSAEGESSIDGGWILKYGEVFKVISTSRTTVHVESITSRDATTNGNIYEFKVRQLKLKRKATKEDLERYMVFGTGCDNKSSLYRTENEMAKEAREVAMDDDWTGEIIGYKLTPIFKVERKTVLKKFKRALPRAKKKAKK